MSNGHGGYRKPSNPAPASGPGKLSKRTDGGPAQKLMAPTGMDYGAHQALMAQERTAPMSQADLTRPAQVPAGPGGQGPSGQPELPPFDAPSARPDEPVTHGVDIGDGGGSEVMPIATQPVYQQQGPMTQMLAGLSAADRSGALANLYQSAIQAGV